MRNIHLSGIILLLVFGCRPSLQTPTPDSGVLSLASYTAIGDGYSAGLADAILSDTTRVSGWHPESQFNSFPALLARQFSLTGIMTFTQPLLPSSGSGRLYIESVSNPTCLFEKSTPVLLAEPGNINWNADNNASIPHNLAIPGLDISDLNIPFSQISTPAWPMLGGLASQSYLELIRESPPGFFSIFLGLDQYIALAKSGDSSPDFTRHDLIDHISLLLKSLTQSSGAKGIIATLPDATSFPYFTRIGNRFLNIENCRGTASPIYITNANGQITMANSEDRILMPVRSLLGTQHNGDGSFGLVSTNPVPAEWVLDEVEVNGIRSSILEYNTVIDSLAEAVNQSTGVQKIAVVDLYAAFQELESGIMEDGIQLSTEYLSGEIFSLDGLYLTARGNAWLANEFISTINSIPDFNASIPPLDITRFQGIKYP